MFTALNTKHSSFGTLHSNTSRETIIRLTNSSMNVPNIMISAINFIIIQNRIYLSDGVSVRRVTKVFEIVEMEEETVQSNKIFQGNPKADTIENVSISSNTLQTIADFKGNRIKDSHDEIANREIILEFLVQNNIRDIYTLSSIIENYYLNPPMMENVGDYC